MRYIWVTIAIRLLMKPKQNDTMKIILLIAASAAIYFIAILTSGLNARYEAWHDKLKCEHYAQYGW